jgi:hypothetical protein
VVRAKTSSACSKPRCAKASEVGPFVTNGGSTNFTDDKVSSEVNASDKQWPIYEEGVEPAKRERRSARIGARPVAIEVATLKFRAEAWKFEVEAWKFRVKTPKCEVDPAVSEPYSFESQVALQTSNPFLQNTMCFLRGAK